MLCTAADRTRFRLCFSRFSYAWADTSHTGRSVHISPCCGFCVAVHRNLHKRFYFSSTRQLSLQACCLWTKMEQPFPKIGSPKTGPNQSFQNWTYLLAEKEEVFSLFYMLGSQIMTPKWTQNWNPKNGFKTAPATTCKFQQKHTHTQTHLQDMKNKNCKAGLIGLQSHPPARALMPRSSLDRRLVSERRGLGVPCSDAGG